MPKKTQKGIVKETEKGTDVRCPNCGQWALIEDYRSFTLNPYYVTELTPVLQCQGEADGRVCLHIFAPTALAFIMREKMLAGIEKE